MIAIRVLAAACLLASSHALACGIETACESRTKTPSSDTTKDDFPPGPGFSHPHTDPAHRNKLILDSHEFASRTCSYDVNCAPGYRCDIRPRFHKGVCVRHR